MDDDVTRPGLSSRVGGAPADPQSTPETHARGGVATARAASASASTLFSMTDRKLALEAWESLFRAQHELFDEMVKDFDDAHLSQAEYDVLLTATRSPGMTARLRDVTSNMLISQPSVSRLIDRMVSRGLISKCPDPEDGRGALVKATDAGARAFRALATVHGRSIAERMSRLDDEELRLLRDLAEKLRTGSSSGSIYDR